MPWAMIGAFGWTRAGLLPHRGVVARKLRLAYAVIEKYVSFQASCIIDLEAYSLNI
jgi:hypothetical protein